MLRRFAGFCLLAASLTGCPSAPEDEPPAEVATLEEEPPEPLPEHLDAQVSEYLQQYGRNWPSFRFHGVVLVARGDDVGMHRAFGLADLASEVPNSVDTHFRIGTMSAQLTAAAVMLLVERGRLSTDHTINKYLPGYPAGDKITVEHLLTHTSGVPNFTDLQTFDQGKHLPKTTAQLVESFRPYGAEHEPGTELTPSNSNYVLLAAIVEKVSGQSFDAFIASDVLAPLAMTATEFGITEEQQALGLEFNEAEHLDPVRSVHPAAFGAAGGYISTAGDLLAFNRGLLDNKLVGEATRDRMMGRLEDEAGYAWVTQQVRGRAVSGWPGLIDGLNCSVLNVVDDGTVVIVLSNTEVVSAGRVAQDVMTMVYGGDAPAVEEHREIPVPLVEQVNALGHYTITRKTEKLIEAVDPERLDSMAEIDVRLDKESLVLDIPEHGRKRMHPMGNGTFFFKDVPRTTAQYTVRSDGGGRLALQQPGGPDLVFIRKGRPGAPKPGA